MDACTKMEIGRSSQSSAFEKLETKPLVPEPQRFKPRLLQVAETCTSSACPTLLFALQARMMVHCSRLGRNGHFSDLGLIIDRAEFHTGFASAARNIPNMDVLPIQASTSTTFSAARSWFPPLAL